MPLADFIRGHREEIVADWETFAAMMQPAAGDMSTPELREHAGELLDAAAGDLDNPQSRAEQKQKSRGLGSARRMATAAEAHADRRIRAGFRLAQVLAEYRALRASVVRLWEDTAARPSAADRRDLTRFNEAVDEALTECVNRYTAQLEHYRDQFLAVLGHDLRNPLSAISMSATSLSLATEWSEKHATAARRILAASARMSRMVGDLLDLTRTQLGAGIPVTRAPTNLGSLSRQVVDELEASHPGRRLLLDCSGDLAGSWDSDRLAQIVSNLVGNALQHGDATKPVTIRVASNGGTAVLLSVHNHGKAIPPKALRTLFDPMVRSAADREHAGQSASLGLGLFIVRELAAAHHGTVRVTSTDAGGTAFKVSLPRYEKRHRAPARRWRTSPPTDPV